MSPFKLYVLAGLTRNSIDMIKYMIVNFIFNYLMFNMRMTILQWSFTNYELGLSKPIAQGLLHRLGSWLHGTSLFEEAWAFVCVHPINWWWSEQLCLFTAGAWTVFIAVEGMLCLNLFDFFFHRSVLIWEIKESVITSRMCGRTCSLVRSLPYLWLPTFSTLL